MRLHLGSLIMLLWFAGLSFIIVATVFASPAIDYRLVMIGSLVPVVEMFLEGPWMLHSLLAPVLVMGFVMIAFQGKRLKQRKWLGVPIGMFLYLFLDRAWTKANLFWWPLFGFQIEKADTPTWEEPAILILMEIAGLLVVGFGVAKYKIYEKENMKLFLKTGRIQRQMMRGN